MRKKPPQRRPGPGRPETPIDWKQVDKFLQAGCDGTEVAAYYGIHPSTFYNRCLEDNNVNFTQYLFEKRSSGKAMLRNAQFKKAIDGKGDSNMLKWLGMHMLDQKDTSRNDPQDLAKVIINALRELESPSGVQETPGPEVAADAPVLDQEQGGKEDSLPPELGAT